MATPVLTKSLTRLRSDYDELAPNRDKSSDGWIGDKAHQQTTSGHNPDDTPGVEAERSDADTKPEVRAIDVDVDLRLPDINMLKTIQKILASPEDLKRLIYIIYNGVIWSKSRNWKSATYTGKNKHTQHAHYSGDPAYDEDAREWSIASMGDDVGKITDAVQAMQIRDTHYTTAKAIPNPAGEGTVPLHVWASWMSNTVKALVVAQQKAATDAAGAAADLKKKMQEIDDEATANAAAAQQAEAEDAARDALMLAEIQQMQDGGATADQVLAMVVSKLQAATA